MTDPNLTTTPATAPRSEWMLRTFAGVAAIWMAFMFTEMVRDSFGEDVWRSLAYALLGVVLTLYWAGIAVLNTPRFRAARARFTSPIGARPVSAPRAIACVLLFLASFAMWFWVPRAYAGMLLFGTIVVGFAVAGYQELRRKPAG